MSVSMFDKMHSARLTRLANHLESNEELGVQNFDFGLFFTQTSVRHCGTAGCALGECLYLWPGEWSLRNGTLGHWVLCDGKNDPTESARSFFGLTEFECDHLFFPDEQRPEKFGGVKLTMDATRYQVAANIRAFLAIKTGKTGDDIDEPTAVIA